MSHGHVDAGEDALADLDLHAWRVPPPPALHRPALVARALAPGAPPRKRSRLAWLLAASVLLNAAIATALVLLLARPTAAPARPDPRIDDALGRLQQEQRDLESKLEQLRQLRRRVGALEELRASDPADRPRDRTAPAPREHEAPAPIAPPHARDPGEIPDAPCDEVSCVLTSYRGACCAALRAPRAPAPSDGLPEALDPPSISRAIDAVKARVAACAGPPRAGGHVVKARIHVDATGAVTAVTSDAHDATLDACLSAAVHHAVFPRTRAGGAFTYPFVF